MAEYSIVRNNEVVTSSTMFSIYGRPAPESSQNVTIPASGADLGDVLAMAFAVEVRKRYKPAPQLVYSFPGENNQWMRA